VNVDIPVFAFLSLALAVFAAAIFGLRGMLDIREALRIADFTRLNTLPHWEVTRICSALLCAVPTLFLVPLLGASGFGAALAVAGLGFAVAPHFLAAARQRAAREVLDDLPLHLDLVALAMEGGASLPSAIAACVEHAPEGVLRRAWQRVVLEIHSGSEPLEALRALAERLELRPFSTLVSALRAAQRLSLDLAPVLRERARQAAASRFARAERRARVAPLRLWATLMLCLVPCTLVVLAYPLARLLARVSG
jgi:tight adherence protein C